MAEVYLLKPPLKAAAKLLYRAVTEYGLEADLAFWMEEDDRWQLFLITPEMESAGPVEVYRKVGSVVADEIAKDPDFPIEFVRVLGPSERLAKSVFDRAGGYASRRVEDLDVDIIDAGWFIIFRLGAKRRDELGDETAFADPEALRG